MLLPNPAADPDKSKLQYTRRLLLKQLAAAPLLLRSADLFGSAPVSLTAAPTHPDWYSARYTPHYPAQSPLEDVLRLVTPGLDDYPTEKYAFDIASQLQLWKQAFESANYTHIEATFAAAARAAQLIPSRLVTLRNSHNIESVRCIFETSSPTLDNRALLQQIPQWLGANAKVETADFEIPSIEQIHATPRTVRTVARFSFVLQLAANRREQRIGTWQIDWQQQTPTTWLVTRLQPLSESRCTLQGRGLEDVTTHALGAIPSYTAQLQHGLDQWRSTIDSASGIDIYGNNGISTGDFDNDGFDDLYISQPAGLPNRLYRNRGDGTFEDVTEKAGVGVLDNTASALFADFRNIGQQDLLVVCGSGPLLFQNNGDGTFRLERDSFRFARPPQGTFTHAAIADYDRDGRLDVYFCLYSYYLGLDQYHYPAPYFDARNGPPNFLMQNQGDGTFIDRTEAAGLNAENDRYSFACAWGDSLNGKPPDLYVVNDFGRNNLYRANGDGTFRAVSEQAHVQDVGAGMSACWADFNNDGRPDLYVANMWSAAGQRVAQQPNFHAGSAAATRALYQHHARGNALYRNNGDGTFTNATGTSIVEAGRWAWGSDAWDFDHDGHQDLYVTNGYITAPEPPASSPTQASAAANIDLGSFFWRQVVAKSPDDASPSLAYEHGWNALNELIRTDSSWSGHERNVLFSNNGDGTFSDISGAAGMDFLEDGRSFALADLDGDGRLEVIVKNRNAPQLRIVHNSLENLGGTIALRLRGTRSNRDSIGAVVKLETGDLHQTKAVQAGTGFLAQHTRELFFGLGKRDAPIQATVHWPSGLVQQFPNLPRNQRVELVEGTATFNAKPFAATSAYTQPTATADRTPEPPPAQIATWLLEPLKAPAFTLPTSTGTTIALESTRGTPVFLHLCATDTPGCADHLTALDRGKAALASNRVRILALDISERKENTTPRLPETSFPILRATPETAGVYNLVFRYLFDRRANLPLPTSFLLDADGNIVKVYQGPVTPKQIAGDAARIPRTAAERLHRALPFPGTLVQDRFTRNDFTYGVAMFQHGYLQQAAESFQQVVARRPDDAEAQYNLGTLSLRENDTAKAQGYLERTVQLKPDYPEAWNNLGMLAAQQGNSAEAAKNFQESLRLRPTYTTALLNLGNLYRHERQFALAQDALTRALALQPDDPEANYSVAMLYAQQGEMPQAQQLLERAIQLRPAYPEALTNLGVLFVRQQNYARAEEAFSTAVRLAPNFEGAYLNLASLYLLQNDKPKARATLETLLRLHPESTAATQALRSLDTAP